MAVEKFGQYILLEVSTENDKVLFSIDSLRIDFDIRNIPGYSVAKFTIFNLSPEVIKTLSGDELFVTISVRTNDGKLTRISPPMYISNAFEELNVPNSEFSMYCYSKLRYKFLSQQVNLTIKRPSLRNIVTQIIRSTKFEGEIEFKSFPDKVNFLNYVPPGPSSYQKGSLLRCLRRLGYKSRYNFNTYTGADKITLIYRPEDKNSNLTNLENEEGLVLSTDDMRGNPKIGPATLSVMSNLNSIIEPGTVLDITRILTAGTLGEDVTLKVAKDYISAISGYTNYQTLSVQHKGSNWSDDWQTQAVAHSPKRGGDRMPIVSWWVNNK